MIEAKDVSPNLLYEWFPMSRQDIADVLNDEENMPDAHCTEDDSHIQAD